MPTNQILPFATGSGANVLSPADYAALAAVASGFQSGVASSQQLNTVWRQSSFVAAMIAQFIADQAAVNVNDDGNVSALETNFETAITKLIQPLIGNIQQNVITITASTTLTTAQAGSLVEYSSGLATSTLTLPAPDTMKGGAFWINNNSSNTQTIATPSGTFPLLGGGSSYSMPTGHSMTAISDGTNWITFGAGDQTLSKATLTSATNTGLDSGYYLTIPANVPGPSGAIYIQFGQFTNLITNESGQIWWPTPFPANVLSVHLTAIASDTNHQNFMTLIADTLTEGGCTIASAQGGPNINQCAGFFLAIGY